MTRKEAIVKWDWGLSQISPWVDSQSQILWENSVKRVNNIQIGWLYTPTIEEFESGITHGKMLYWDLMGSLLAYLPQYSNAIIMAMRPMDNNTLWLSAHLVALSARLELDSKNQWGKVLIAFQQIIRILKYARWEESDYKGKNYTIYNFTPPEWRTDVNESTFYLLYLINQENPEYLSIENLN